MNNNLYLVHNISSTNFIDSINKFNGLICPSLAIIKDDNYFNKFGNITLLIDPDFIFDGDTKINKNNKKNYVYNGDSYSSTFPEILLSFKKQSLNLFLSESIAFFDHCNDYYSDFELFMKNGRSLDSSYNYLLKLNGLKYKFLIENSIIDKEKFKFPYIENKSINSPLIMSKKLKKYLTNKTIDNINIEELKSILNNDINIFDNFFKYTNNSFLNKRIENKKSIFKKDLDIFLNSSDLFSTDLGLSIFSFFDYLNKKDIKKIDNKKLKEILDKKLSSSKNEYNYKKYLMSILKEVTQNEYFILNQKKYNFNEENILKYFKNTGTKHSENTLTYSINKAKSNNLSRIYDFETILEKSNNINSDFFDDISKKLFQDFKFKLSHLLKKDIDIFDFNDELSNVVVNMHKQINSDDYLFSHLSKFIEKNDLTLLKDDFVSINKKINHGLFNYFEVKNLDKLYLKNIVRVLVPKNTNPFFIKFLKEKCIDYSFFYDEKSYLEIISKQKKSSLNNFYQNKNTHKKNKKII